jgi:2-polyprenyl-3-methyl-5-hydroxy-6-metoxy-1,4-benzoquinol methylase
MIGRLKRLAKSVAQRLLRREIVLLPLVGRATGSAPDRAQLLPMRYTYRATTEGIVEYRFLHRADEVLYSLTEASGDRSENGVGEPLLHVRLSAIEAESVLSVNLIEGVVRLNGESIAVKHMHRPRGRKFAACVRAVVGGIEQSRQVSHYLPCDGKEIGRDYYFGDDYTDYTKQAEVEDGLKLVRSYCNGGRLLDVGCALGLYVRAFIDAGFDAHGVDISEFAVTEAARRVGDNRVRRCNLDADAVPFDKAFDVFWMWDVLEHSSEPRRLLEKITRASRPGTTLFLHTSNIDSLTHQVLGKDWEGYSDYSHHGIEAISASNLALWLDELGWGVLDWRCQHLWVGGTDPVLLRLRDAFHRIPELALFLSERGLGDMITVVARLGASNPSHNGRNGRVALGEVNVK